MLIHQIDAKKSTFAKIFSINFKKRLNLQHTKTKLIYRNLINLILFARINKHMI